MERYEAHVNTILNLVGLILVGSAVTIYSLLFYDVFFMDTILYTGIAAIYLGTIPLLIYMGSIYKSHKNRKEKSNDTESVE